MALRSYLSILSILIWIGYQIVYILHHDSYSWPADPYRFIEYFNYIGIGRTNLHSKTMEYWTRSWFQSRTIKQVGNTTFTLIHFDYHSNYDITYDIGIGTCSPAQLIYYHQLVEEVRYDINCL